VTTNIAAEGGGGKLSMQSAQLLWLAAAFTVSTFTCGCAIMLLWPLWRHFALAKPNARSSHKLPTPQGGGVAILAGILCACVVLPMLGGSPELYSVLLAALALGAVGTADDLWALDATPRLAAQVAAAIVVIAVLPTELRLAPVVPLLLERCVLVLALVWFINLTNFMDGIDWMTVAETVPLTAALAMFGLVGSLPTDATFVATALCGAMLAFAPFNKPVARLFLGDAGSLPIGLLVGWLLIRLGEHQLAAALLLPLYYVGDATTTLLRRLLRGEALMQAHRCHFYQRAFDSGVDIFRILRIVLFLNLALISLAATSILTNSVLLRAGTVAIGCLLVGLTLLGFEKHKLWTPDQNSN
jgi:UDP-N-acetylmuramyl pentapeptide phosphotransferase/UDP-N-acetylglucosamine-1-phosphate transferase